MTTASKSGTLKARGLAFALAALCVACVPVPVASSDPNERPVSGSGPAPYSPVFAPGVSGRVLARTGVPVAGVMVQAMSDGARGAPIPELAVFTDGNGVFHWPLRPGHYVLSVAIPQRGTVRLPVHVPTGQGIYVEIKPG